MFEDFQLPKIREFEDLTQGNEYATGIYDRNKAKYIYALPNTINPNMTSPFVLEDGDVRLEPGFYEVALSDDKRYLLLIQSRELKALVPTIKVVIKRESEKELNARHEELEKEKQKLKKKNKTTKKLETLEKNEEELNMSAKIYDSQEGYYVIEYNKKNVYAWGYVPK